VWVAQKTTGSTGQIGLNLRIDNKTAQSADMSAVTLRYWYQDEGLGTALSLSVMYASIGYSLQGRVILNKVVSVSPASPGADHYLELSFAGTLAAQGDASTNDRFSIQVTVHTLGYTGAVDVTNDYSYDGGAALLYEQKITLHDANGNVIWGVAPGTSPVGGADAAVDTSVSGDVGLPDIPYPQPDVPIAGTGGVPSTGGITTTGGATASGGTTSVGGTTTTDAATASGGSGGSNDASGSDDAATDGGNPPPSCSGLAATCGPSGNESCCTSLLVPGGTFFRSYDGVDFTDPNYPATVADFYLDKYEITVGRFRAFVNAGMGTQLNPPASGAGANPLIAGSGWDSTWNTSLSADTASLKAAMQCDLTYQTWTDTAGDNESMPVNCMNWYTAFAFCAWDGARLPTEAEWNYAAAGGSEQRYYPWSSPATSTTIDDSYAVYCGGSCTPQNVGSKSPTGDGKWGQSDLAGNLWEWMLDYYADPYPMPCDSCVASIAAFDRVARGGCFSDVASNLRSALRNNNDPSGHSFAFGARCARSSL
jgi:formylglycine-generating enzyme required for sulfatase activity